MPHLPPRLGNKKQAAGRVIGERKSSFERGYDDRWRRARRRFLSDNPLCAHCLREGLSVAASVVDHVIPHRGDKQLFWDEDNWQSLCKTHHDKKTGSGL